MRSYRSNVCSFSKSTYFAVTTSSKRPFADFLPTASTLRMRLPWLYTVEKRSDVLAFGAQHPDSSGTAGFPLWAVIQRENSPFVHSRGQENKWKERAKRTWIHHFFSSEPFAENTIPWRESTASRCTGPKWAEHVQSIVPLRQSHALIRSAAEEHRMPNVLSIAKHFTSAFWSGVTQSDEPFCNHVCAEDTRICGAKPGYYVQVQATAVQ
jgi:hypothetical protein